MSRKTKAWGITAIVLMIAGTVLFAAGMMLQDWDFAKLDTTTFVTNEYTIRQDFQKISVQTDRADLILLPSDGDTCRVVCFEEENIAHRAEVKEDTLIIRSEDERAWYEHIGIFFGRSKITVYLPQTTYESLLVRSDTGDVKIPTKFSFAEISVTGNTGRIECLASTSGKIKLATDTGDISMEHVTAGGLELAVSTGRVTLSDVQCRGDATVKVSTGKSVLTDLICNNFVSTGNTGDISMKNLTAKQKLFVERSTGDVKFDHCDGAEIQVKTDTGDVKGTLRSEKVFFAQTDTGRVEIPKTTAGGICDVTTDTGDILLKLAP